MIKYCRNCVYPETKPDLTFDEDGVCDACRFANVKDATDWDSRRKELVEIFNKFKNKDGSNYDCIIGSICPHSSGPYSGGRQT